MKTKFFIEIVEYKGERPTSGVIIANCKEGERVQFQLNSSSYENEKERSSELLRVRKLTKRHAKEFNYKIEEKLLK